MNISSAWICSLRRVTSGFVTETEEEVLMKEPISEKDGNRESKKKVSVLV